MTHVRVKIPCTIEAVATENTFVEINRKMVPRDRHTLKIKLPGGQTLIAQVSNLERQKLDEIIPNSLVEEDS